MKFENPIMNISMFEVENIVTDSNKAVDAATEYLKGEAGVAPVGSVKVVF